MSDEIAAMIAVAGVAQASFGEGGGGIASRLQAAMGLELERARTDAEFAAAKIPSAAFAGVVERRGPASPVWSSLAGERPGATRDSRVRGSKRDRSEGHHGEGDEGGRHGAAAGSEPVTLPCWQLVAIKRALRTACDAAADAGCSGSLQGLVLPGTVAGGNGGESACSVFVLCTSFDGDLGATRRVWGFGYADTVLAATLDGRRSGADRYGDEPRAWAVERLDDVVDGEHRTAALTHGSKRWVGPMVAEGSHGPMPERWEFTSVSGPLPC